MTSFVNHDHRSAGPSLPRFGSASTAHPLATAAALDLLEAGGSAVDAVIAAHAVIAVVLPDAAGLGGDLLALVREPDGSIAAVNGTGKSPARAPAHWAASGGASVTIPGLVHSWTLLHERWGVASLEECLAPAIRLASDGFAVDAELTKARDDQFSRLVSNGATGWSLLTMRPGDIWRQPELSRTLAAIAECGSSAFYDGATAAAIQAAVVGAGGSLSLDDLRDHRTELPDAVAVDWNGGQLWVQPPSSQGLLLAMAAQWVDRAIEAGQEVTAHGLVEATEAAFASRDDVASGDPEELLNRELDVDLERAGGRGGPRGYLHTAGAAVADRSGLVVSSLISIFDDFGSGVYVPEIGSVMNNRAAGFTSGANAPRAGARPVHTLAPALFVDADGDPLALATPGADGQVQTLLQVLSALRVAPTLVDDALSAPRWRSQDGGLLIEHGHPAETELRDRGHRLQPRAFGDPIFGAVVAAGIRKDEQYAAADPRRATTGGAR